MGLQLSLTFSEPCLKAGVTFSNLNLQGIVMQKHLCYVEDRFGQQKILRFSEYQCPEWLS